MGTEHTRLRDAIRKITGMYIEDDKIYLIETRLGEIMRDYNLDSYDDLSVMLEQNLDDVFVNRVIEKITTHETRFFRDESIFDALVMQIVPEWLEKKGATMSNLGNNRFEIWSAGCSTGQEAYSLAMILKEKLPEVFKKTTILGTDISKDTIEKARKGIFTRFEVERGVPDMLLRKYFEEVDKNTYKVVDEISANIRFEYHNLLDNRFPGSYDALFFRNVAIYFEEHQRKILYERMIDCVKKDGVLVLGSAESLSGYVKDYIIREYGLARYYEVNAALVTIFK